MVPCCRFHQVASNRMVWTALEDGGCNKKQLQMGATKKRRRMLTLVDSMFKINLLKSRDEKLVYRQLSQ